MNTKLTIRLDNEVINKAKQYALRNKTSLSKLVEAYFRELTNNYKETKMEVTDKELQKVSGTVSIPDSVTIDDLLTDRLFNKYIHD